MLLRYTTRTFKSRRLDSHQHEAVYKTAAFHIEPHRRRAACGLALDSCRANAKPHATNQVDREGVAPSFPACGAGVVLLDQQPSFSGR
jgi:hypothetical protein